MSATVGKTKACSLLGLINMLASFNIHIEMHRFVLVQRHLYTATTKGQSAQDALGFAPAMYVHWQYTIPIKFIGSNIFTCSR